MKHKGKHGSHRDHPQGAGHGHMERGLEEHAGLVAEPHAHKPAGVGAAERGHKHPHDKMGLP